MHQEHQILFLYTPLVITPYSSKLRIQRLRDLSISSGSSLKIPSGHVVRFTQGRILDGDFAVFNLAKLQSNAQYCFSVWTRVDSTTGCRSQQPSGKVCAWTSDPAQPALNEAHGVTQGQSDTPEPVQVASSGSGNSGGDGGSGGNTGSNGSGGPTLTTVNGVQCCKRSGRLVQLSMLSQGNLICAPPQHWYCE